MAKRRMGLIIFVLYLCLLLLPCQAQAASTTDAKEPIDTEKNCSLTMSYCSEDIVFSKLPIKLYKIADVSKDYQYTLASSFAESNLILNGIQRTGEWNVIGSTLESYILANGVAADFDAVTDTEGKVSFDELKPGLYLAVADSAINDETTYVFDSALIALPGLGTDGLWQYQVAVKAKCEIIPPAGLDEVIELRVTKLWKGDDEKNRPESIEVEIFYKGTSYEVVKLSDDNNWTYSWKAKNDVSNWKVVERNIPSGYMMTVDEKETSFVITNTLDRDPNEGPERPQTGDTSNVMLWFILMMISGTMFIILGITRKRSRV